MSKVSKKIYYQKNKENHNILQEKNKKELPIWINLIILSFPIALYLLFRHLGSSIDYFIIGENPKKTSNV
ncbi:MAG: hypothetical protein Q8783_01400, partial [Candidatus Phytoplasma stylosanthis]|nr:hypothetical protein [Candidatus Phytoplasma stylosanthis]